MKGFINRKQNALARITLEMAALQRRWARLLKRKTRIYALTKGKA